MCHNKALQPDRKFDITAANHVLDLELAEAGLHKSIIFIMNVINITVITHALRRHQALPSGPLKHHYIAIQVILLWQYMG